MRARIGSVASAITLVGVLLLAGCTPGGSGAGGLHQDWQTSVVAIAELAATGDEAAALESLAALEAELGRAEEAGDLTAARAATIQRSLELVRTDLEAASTAGTVPAPAEPDDGTVVDQPAPQEPDPGGGNGKGKGDEKDKKK